MATDGEAAGEQAQRSAQPHSHLFAVRLWKADGAEGSEYRGSVRDVVSGAFRNFREWSDLAAFMVGRVEEVESARAEEDEGGLHGDARTGE